MNEEILPMNRIGFVVTVGSVGIHVCATGLLAWGTLAHCVISIQANSTAGPGYHNAPDYFPSKHIGWEDFGVTDEFCWTHLTQRTSAEGSPWHWINMPTYYQNPLQEADNSPSEHMAILLGQKLRADRRTLSMTQLMRGWGAHNREDRAWYLNNSAHFYLFPGPNSHEQVLLWQDHRRNEWYCNILVYVDVIWQGDVDAAFAGFEDGSPPTGFPPDWEALLLGQPTGDDASDALVCLAMKAFRKKQQAVDTVVPCGVQVQSRSAVLASRDAEVGLLLGYQHLMAGENYFRRYQYYEAKDWMQHDPMGLGQQVVWFYFAAVLAAGGE